MLKVEHIFEHLLGQFLLPWLKLKQSSKRCSHKHFSKYLLNNFRTPFNHHKNYAKSFFCSRILHLYLHSHFLRESIFKWSWLQKRVFLTCIWIPGRTCGWGGPRSKCGWIRVLHKMSFSLSTGICFFHIKTLVLR